MPSLTRLHHHCHNHYIATKIMILFTNETNHWHTNIFIIVEITILLRDGNGVGRDGKMGSSLLPPMVLSWVLTHSLPASHDGKNFLTPSHLLKLYFLLICPQLLSFFLIKPYFFNKNILEITTKFIPLHQTNFSKNWIILFKCLTKITKLRQRVTLGRIK